MKILKIFKLPQKISNFQVGHVPGECFHPGGGDNLSQNLFASIPLPNSFESRHALVRCSLEQTQDDEQVVWCDTRVQRIVKTKRERRATDNSSGTTTDCATADEDGNEVAQERVLNLNDEIGELDLAHHVLEMEMEEENWENSLNTTMPIQILRSSAIKKISLTVICHSDLHYVGSLSPPSNEGKWKRLENKIRNVFQTYDIHVTNRTLVQLKRCPLASVNSDFSPSVAYVFIEDCEMRGMNVDIGIGRVTGRTEIIIRDVHHISHYRRLVERKKGIEGSHLFGLEDVAKLLYSVMRVQMGLLISGPSGSGKTLLVQEVARNIGAELYTFNPAQVTGDLISVFCEGLTDLFVKSVMTASRYPTVFFFPQIHLLFQKGVQGGKTSSRSKQQICHHLSRLFDSIPQGVKLTVVGSTDKSYLIPLELRRAGRLEKEIVIHPPKLSDRFKMLKKMCSDSHSFNHIDLHELAKQTPGYVPQDLLKLVRLAMFKSQEEDCSEVSEHHVKYALGRVLPSVLQGATGLVDIQRAVSLDDIAGLDSVKLDLIKAIVWPLKYTESFLRMGIQPPRGILLYGPPGNCKTTLVRALAATHQTNFLSVSGAELFSSGVGDSEKIVAQLFHRARMASPSILFIDELESIVGSRQSSEGKGSKSNESILSMLLTEMDGVGVSGFSRNATVPLVIVVGATNRPDLIDPALLRPGRFDKLIPVPPLDFKGRLELFQIMASKVPFHSNVNFSKIANETEYYSGADLVNLCKEAAINALTLDMNSPSVSDEDFKKARQIVGPSLTSAMIKSFYEYGNGAAPI